jgi:PAS domain S-box-containing protein
MPDSLKNMSNTERRLTAMFETTTDAILIIDHEQKITLANRAAERLFGYSPENLLHQRIDMLIPMRFHNVHHQHVQEFGKTGTSVRRMGGEANVVGMRADGTEFPIDASISHLLEDGKPLYTVILRDITERKRAEEELKLSREYLRSLYDNLQTIREEERKRIARELHDDLGQTLGAVRIDLTLLRNTLPPDLPELEKNAALIDKLLLSAITSVRRISSDLRPRPLDDLGLVPALQMLADEFSQRHNIVCNVSAPAEDVRLPDEIASPLFRMVQESLNNVAKHAEATHVHVDLSINAKNLLLTITDNGIGLTDEDTKKSDSFGLIGMRERAWAMGGSLEVSCEAVNSGATEDAKGTKVCISIPLNDIDISASTPFN